MLAVFSKKKFGLRIYFISFRDVINAFANAALKSKNCSVFSFGHIISPLNLQLYRKVCLKSKLFEPAVGIEPTI